jgi:hypothetical protein
MTTVDNDVVQYCRQCTDRQLEEVLRKEWAAHKHRDYPSAVKVSEERGWTVKNGERQ